MTGHWDIDLFFIILIFFLFGLGCFALWASIYLLLLLIYGP